MSKKIKIHLLVPIGFVIFSLVIFSCGPYKVKKTDNALMATEQITLQGFSNNISTDAVQAKIDRLDSGSLKVTVQLIRQRFGSQFVEIKVFFVDKDGFQVEETNWEPVHLEEDVITQHEVISLGSNAEDFRMVIRTPPDAK
ncbi:MAG: hypothetical protein C4523_20835 [Myxococcales bacterium]|nr:MAG: hypothetical protein C4523_20835 [Myxococcales bacterium]